MATAVELAVRLRRKLEEMQAIGGYSVEAETMIVLVETLAEIAEHVASLEELAKRDLRDIVQQIAAAQKRAIEAKPSGE